MPVRGGDRFEAEMRAISRRLGTSPHVNVGFPEHGTYPKTGVSIPLVAAINEFGAPSRGIPSRPFMRNTIKKHGKDWPKAAAALLRSLNFDVHRTLEQVGDGIKGQMIQVIHDGVPPPNAPSTIARKQFARVASQSTGGVQTLIDSGIMWRSITVEVHD